MNWTTKTPTVNGYYWHRKGQHKAINMYFVMTNRKIGEVVGACRRCDFLSDLETISDLGGEWFGPIIAPQ